MIGVTDSGIGGLSVVDTLLKRRLEEDPVYFGDSGCAPCGHRNLEQVAAWAGDRAGVLRRLGAALLVLAGRTAGGRRVRRMVSVLTPHVRQAAHGILGRHLEWEPSAREGRGEMS